jgi:hypothetical protein
MRVRITVPDDLFDAVEHLARRSGRHRSVIYADALREYLTHHDPDWVTESYDRVLDEVGDYEEELAFVRAAAYLAFQRLEELDGGWGRAEGGDERRVRRNRRRGFLASPAERPTALVSHRRDLRVPATVMGSPWPA